MMSLFSLQVWVSHTLCSRKGVRSPGQEKEGRSGEEWREGEKECRPRPLLSGMHSDT